MIASKYYKFNENIMIFQGNKAVFLEANIHAREWITSATATWFLNELLTSTDPEVRRLAENYDWHILVVTNPDGYVYSHTTVRKFILYCGKFV